MPLLHFPPANGSFHPSASAIILLHATTTPRPICLAGELPHTPTVRGTEMCSRGAAAGVRLKKNVEREAEGPN